MTTKKLLRKIHYWLSLAVMLPSLIMIAAGIVLMVKKDIDWIQPATEKGAVYWEVPAVSIAQLTTIAANHPDNGIASWTDIKKIDVRPNKGIAKLISKDSWETQIDTSNGKVLAVNYRRSDMFEAIHDGSFFSNSVKLYIFLPTGILLFVMWATGVYLFFLPRLTKAKKKSKRIIPQ